MVRLGLVEKIRFEQRVKGFKRLSEGTVFQAQGTASAKAVRKGDTWYTQGTQRPMWLEVNEQGERNSRCCWSRGQKRVKRVVGSHRVL